MQEMRRLLALSFSPLPQCSPCMLGACGGLAPCYLPAAAYLHSSAIPDGADDKRDGTVERDKRYVDRLKVTVRAGSGGNGCISFWRSVGRGKNVPADGGNGGNGGNVVVRASANMRSLAGVQQLYKAEAGGHGSKQRQHEDEAAAHQPSGNNSSGGNEGITGGKRGAGAVGASSSFGVASSLSTGAQQRQPGTGTGRHRPRMHLLSRKRPREAAAGAGGSVDDADVDSGEQLRRASEEELPDWIKRLRQPWVGARDYRSDDEEEEEGSSSLEGEQGEEEEEGREGGSRREGGRGGGQSQQVLADLVQDGQEVVVATGGLGGRGNAAFHARPNRPAPRESEKGEVGEHCQVLLELKLLADVGLVGLPNAGKSTLLRAISNATPKVGSYAFTTLGPQLGVVELPGDARIVVADIPGLIEGASRNRGLGHHFLRHIERTKALAYVVDASAGLDGAPGVKPWDALDLLQHEILEYAERLDTLPALVVANKVDLLPRPAAVIRDLEGRTDLPVVAVSGKERQGIPELLQALQRVVAEGSAGGERG